MKILFSKKSKTMNEVQINAYHSFLYYFMYEKMGHKNKLINSSVTVLEEIISKSTFCTQLTLITKTYHLDNRIDNITFAIKEMNVNMPNPVIVPSFLSHFVTCFKRGSPFFAISVGFTVLSPTVFVIVVGLHVAGVVEISFELCDVNVLNAFVVTGCVVQNVVGI